jgi:HK97 family phage major capsid protein
MSTTTTTRARSARSPSVTITREERTYRPDGQHGFFRDSFRAKLLSDDDARARLERHATETAVEARTNATRAPERRSVGGETVNVNYERRSWLDLGQGGYGTPPAWLIQETATAPRPERCLSGLIDSAPLPRGCSSVNIPRLTTGTSTAVTPPAAPVTETDIADAATTSRVVEIVGHADVPIQMFDQSPTIPGAHLDAVLGRDLTSAYDASLEAQVIYGTGGSTANAQILGVLNCGGGAVTYTSASPTGSAIYPYFGSVAGYVADNRRVRGEAWLARGARHAWLASSEDASARPLEVPLSAQAIINDPTKPNPIGSIINYPLFTSEAIPVTLGTAANQDAVLMVRYSDMLLWESSPRLDILDEVLSSTMEIRLQLRCYAAAILARYPTGIAVLGGTGMTVPTGE